MNKVKKPYVLHSYEIINCPHPRNHKVVYKFSDEDFGFDTNNPRLLKKFLEEIKVGEKPLPRKSERGLPIAYMLMDMRGRQNKKIFPVNFNDGKRRPVCLYGFLDVPLLLNSLDSEGR